MNRSKIISVDLAKDVFEVAVADARYRIVERHRLTRRQFARFLAERAPARVLMESCGTAHYWARQAHTSGHAVDIIPAQYVKPYRRRNKTDRTDTEALLEAHRCEGIQPVPVRSVEQQQIQQLHRIREQWKRTRTQRINGLRGFLRELGCPIREGAIHAQRRAREILDHDAIPQPLETAFGSVLDEISMLECHIKDIERQLQSLTRANTDVQRLQQVQGIGLLTSTAMVAAAGSPHHFKSGRRFASWIGLTPREYSSGNIRYMGRISKQGDRYLRMLLTHGARSVLARAKQLHKAGKPMNPLQRWAWQLESRVGHNKATCALANKLARICWAVWKHQRQFDPNFVTV